MALREDEKTLIRYHLGYPLQTTAPGIIGGQVIARQTQFLLEWAMDHLQPTGEEVIRGLLAQCGAMEQEIGSAACLLVAQEVGNVKLRESKPGSSSTDLLDGERRRWALRMADALGVPAFPYSARMTGTGRQAIKSVPLRRAGF
jgi:hypothetical protein